MAIKVYKKNLLDLTYTNVAITVTDAIASDNGQSIVDLMRNRQNSNGWITTGSTDAANTTLIFDMVDEYDFDNIIMTGINLKAYTLKYWNGSSYVNFSTTIAETTNSATTKNHTFTSVTSSKIELVITGTMTVDDDKAIAQMIVTGILGTFSNEPEVSDIEISKERVKKKTISGKSKIIKNVGAFSCRIKENNSKDNTDLTLVETLHDQFDGFLLWLSGGSTSDYSTNIRWGYRLQDIFHVDIENEYAPTFDKGTYSRGLAIDLKLSESV